LCGGQKSDSARVSLVPSGWTFSSSLPVNLDQSLNHELQQPASRAVAALTA